MKLFITLLILLTTSTAFANSSSALYFLTSSDAKALSSGFQYALSYGKKHDLVEWTNPETGLSGKMVPTKTYQTTFGQVCREYTASVELDGSIQQAVGMACLQKDGNWKVTGEKQIKQHDSRLKFVYAPNHENSYAQKVYAHPPVGQSKAKCSTGQKGNYHSDSFHENFRTYRKQHQRAPEKIEIKQREPSKLIRLVAY